MVEPVLCESNEALVRRCIDPINMNWNIAAPSELAEHEGDTRVEGTTRPYREVHVGGCTVRGRRVSRFAEHFDPIRYVVAIGGQSDPPPTFSLASGQGNDRSRVQDSGGTGDCA